MLRFFLLLIVYTHYNVSTNTRVVTIIYLKSLSASTIRFTPANASFVPGLLYEELDLQCGLVESTSNNVKHVVNIVINRSGKTVASVSDYSSAKAADDQTNLHVEGDVSGTAGNKW